MLRLLRRIGAVAALVAAGTLFPGNAGALNQGEMYVEEGQSIEKSFPIIAGNNPANAAHDPETCRLSPYCDVIRLNVEPPTDPDLGFFVRIVMSWTTRAEVDTVVQGEMTDNDMDMFVYQVPYDDTKDSSDNEVATGATGAQPEIAYINALAVDIVIVNFLGANTDGYTLKVTYVVDETFSPFELLEDESGPTTQEESFAPTEAPIDLAGAVEAVAAPPEIVSPTLSDVAVDDPFGLSGLAASTKPPEAAVNLLREVNNAAATKPDPVSTGTAMLWLAVVPGALLASAFVFLARRRSSGFNL
jgi:hypothetical protein